MIYFFSRKLTNQKSELIEKSIRSFSSKRNLNLDLKSTATLIEDESRYFLGVENKKFLKITRLRTPFEKYLPKLIVRFSKSDFREYKVRFSIFTFLITLFLIFALINELLKIIFEDNSINNFLLVLVFLIILFVLTKLELMFVKKRIDKAINKHSC